MHSRVRGIINNVCLLRRVWGGVGMSNSFRQIFEQECALNGAAIC